MAEPAARPASAGRSLPSRIGLRAQFAVVLGAVLIPAVACSIWLGYLAYLEYVGRLGATLRASANVISTYEDELVGEAEATLRRLISVSSVADMREPGCSAYLAEELRRYGKFLTLARLDDSGTTRCASIPDLTGISYADRRWLSVMRKGDQAFVISEVIVGRVLRRPTVVVALRVGEAAGSLAASMDVRGFTPTGARSALVDTTSSFVLVDNDGYALIEPRPGEPDQSLTIPPRDVILAALADAGNTFEATGLDGVRRLYAIAPVAEGSLHVVLGTLVGGRWDWLATRAPMILAPILMLLLALAAIWVATSYLVGRHVQALARAARRWSDGHGHGWPVLSDAPAEFAELGLTFSEMAERIATREDELQASLTQKEILLKEIHHRVKNNLQIVSSLINLRARASRSEDVRHALEAVQMRIKALALVHRNLYEQEEPTSVDLETFLVELCQLFSESAGADEVEIHAEVQPGRASADRATPIALLIAEGVTNALRHAFPDGRKGTVVVGLERVDERVRLSIADDGVGRRETGGADGVGLTLCRMLAKQIGGELEISGPPGTIISVLFSERRPQRPINGGPKNSGLPAGNPDATSDVSTSDGT